MNLIRSLKMSGRVTRKRKIVQIEAKEKAEENEKQTKFKIGGTDRNQVEESNQAGNSLATRPLSKTSEKAKSCSKAESSKSATTVSSQYFEKNERNRKDSSSEESKTISSENVVHGKDFIVLKTSSSSWEPSKWQEQLANIREMRAVADAPVDTMGCHILSDPQADPKIKRYQTLVSLMLSSQTKDEITSAAMDRLKRHGCTPHNIFATSDQRLGQLITPVGFWKKKVDYLKKTAAILENEYDGDIPGDIKGLCSLPGVGPKMAHITMQVAWSVNSGIGVDTHVHRISNRLKWVRKETKDPERTREELEAWLPKEYWNEINQLLVGFGQQICTPLKPKCDQCLNRLICPASTSKRTKK